MFTGIIEELGEITRIEPSGDGVRLTVRAPKAVSDAAHGDSIAVSGVCLTVVGQDADSFTADVMKQTLDMSTLGGFGVGTPVNLERATATGGRLGGHIVQGHVDGTGSVLEVRPGAQWSVVRVSLPASSRRSSSTRARSRSTASHSRSATSARAPEQEAWFEVSLIPETLAATTLGGRPPATASTSRPTSWRGTCSACSPSPPTSHERRRLAMSLASIPEAIEALKAGRPIIVADDENRENEGDAVISAELASPGVDRVDRPLVVAGSSAPR